MRLANLNVFVPTLVLAEAFLITPVMLLVSILAMPFRSFIKTDGAWLYLMPYIIIFLSVMFIAAKYDLSPLSRKPEREGRYRAGHWLLGITTLVIFVAVATPFVMAKIYSNNELTLYTWYALPVIGIGFFTWAGGLYMVRSTRV